MSYIYIAFQVILYFAIPIGAIQLAKHYKIFEWLSPIVLCYLAGMAMVNTPIIDVHTQTAVTITEATIPIAMPLILFSSDFKAWLKQSRDVVISFLCAVGAVIISSSSAAYFLGHLADEFWKASGMLVGVYTGGTPNLNSIGMALQAEEEMITALNGFDVVVSGFYLLFLLTLAKPILSHIFPAFPFNENEKGEKHGIEDEPLDPRGAIGDLSLALGLSIFIVAASAGLTWLVFGHIAVAGVFLGLTTGGIVASFFEGIRNLDGTYELGDYFILVFSVAMGARTDFAQLLAEGGALLGYTAFVVIGAILIHYTLTALFRIDVDTVLITSTAALYGPAFVPVIAEALGNRRVILSGLTAGLVGYAIGNYVGIGLATVLGP